MYQDGGHGRKHSHNLSINSASSLSEPTTPPTSQSVSRNMQVWDSSKGAGLMVLPSLNVDHGSHVDHDSKPLHRHSRQVSTDSVSDKENLKPSGHSDRKSLYYKKIDKEFLASVNKTPLSGLKDMIVKLAKDQHGCRFLQKRIDECSVPSLQERLTNSAIIFEQIEGNLYELIIDPFGNYLVQKLIDYCDELTLNKFVESLSTNLFQISINQHGTRALQKIVDRMSNDYQLALLVRGLLDYIIELIKDLNGNHVIQKILNKYPPDNCQFIYDAITQDLLVVATHKHGCCVLQKCLNHVNEAQRLEFSKVILKYSNFTHLVNDQFGNYVLQYLVSTNSIDVNVHLFENITHYGIRGLCTSKFSSNVIEKLLKNCYTNEHIKTEMNTLSTSEGVTFSNLKFTMIHYILNSDLNKIVNDPYGNYVIQTLIDILIHPNGVYFSESPSGERIMLPTLGNLLDDNFQSSVDSLQVQIIKKWLMSCQITSSFGKRIQMKINSIISGSSKPYSKTPKETWKSQTSSTQKRFTPQHKQPNYRYSNLGSYGDHFRGDQSYEFHEMDQYMANMSIKNGMRAESLKLGSNNHSHKHEPYMGEYMANEQSAPRNHYNTSIKQAIPGVRVNNNHINVSPNIALGANVPTESTNNFLYPGQQCYATSGLNGSQMGSLHTQLMRAYQPATEHYSAFDNQASSWMAAAQMPGHAMTEQYPKFSYINSSGRVYDPAELTQSKRFYPSFG